MIATPLLLTLATVPIFAAPQASRPCPPINGNFTVGLPDLYPESAAFDSQTCKIYISSTANNTLVEYDPYSREAKVISFWHVTKNEDYLLSGVDFNPTTGHVFISANARAAFFSNGANLDGPNTLIEYSPKRECVVRRTDLDSTVARVEKAVGQQIGGFQDQAEDSFGNAYYMATWGNVLLKVDRQGQASPYYVPSPSQLNTSTPGFGGITIRDTTLMVSDAISQSFLLFDLQLPTSKPRSVHPAGLPSQQPVLLCDSLYLPERYDGTVALCTSDFAFDVGGISVYYSPDRWQSAVYQGFILNDFIQSPNGTATATFEATGALYAVVAYIHSASGETPEPSNFPFVDITERVDQLARIRASVIQPST